eukprot:EC824300.1.p1 GENE.EC824300.1~~EC824300.1.p1  ORF type:complete len:224 (+),score=42.09 EC824300.1:27-698(+)
MNFEQLFKNIPIITRMYLVSTVLIGAAVSLEILNPYQLFFDYNLIKKGEFWRILTTFLYFDKFSINFIFNIYFVHFYFSRLEEHSFHGKTEDFLFMLLFNSILISIFSYYYQMLFLSSCLVSTVLYIWAKRNPYENLALFGIIGIRSAYLPFIMLVLAFFTGSFKNDAIGFFVGHVYFFFKDILTVEYNINILKTPKLLNILFQNYNQRNELNINFEDNFNQQ